MATVINENGRPAGFTFFQSFYEGISVMPEDKQLEAYNILFRFAFYDELPGSDIDPWVKSATVSPIQTIKSGIENVLNGKKGGRPRKDQGGAFEELDAIIKGGDNL